METAFDRQVFSRYVQLKAIDFLRKLQSLPLKRYLLIYFCMHFNKYRTVAVVLGSISYKDEHVHVILTYYITFF